MPRKRLQTGEKLKELRLYIKEKYIHTPEEEEELRSIAYKAITAHVIEKESKKV